MWRVMGCSSEVCGSEAASYEGENAMVWWKGERAMRQILGAVIVAACVPSAAFAVRPSGALQSGSVVLNTATYDATVDFAVYNATDYLANGGATTSVAGSNPGATNTEAGQIGYDYQLTAVGKTGSPTSKRQVCLAASHGENGEGYDPGAAGDGRRGPLWGGMGAGAAGLWTFMTALGRGGTVTSKRPG